MDTSETYIKTPEHRRRLSIAMIGNQNQERIRSPETIAKISESMRGNTNTLGKVYGKDTRAKERIAKTGECNPAWQGGTSFDPYPYQFNSSLKATILDRDNYACQLCGATPEDRRELHPHHKDYDKANCLPSNLITLCHSCHSKTNHHREEWGVLNGQFQRIPVNA